MIVAPTGYKTQETFLNNYFHDMSRVFQMELDKPQSVLLVIGFSFQDQHIARMVNRALQNPELMVYIFVYRGQGDDIKENLNREQLPQSLKLILPSMIYSKSYIDNNETDNLLIFTLDNLTEILLDKELINLQDKDNEI